MYETLSDTKIFFYNAINFALKQKIVYKHQKDNQDTIHKTINIKE